MKHPAVIESNFEIMNSRNGISIEPLEVVQMQHFRQRDTETILATKNTC